MMQTNRAPHRPQAAVLPQNEVRARPVSAMRRLSVCRSQMHPAVYKLAVLSWAMFMAVFWITFFVSSNALFMVVVGTFYAFMFFGVPFVFTRIAPKADLHGLSLGEFLRGRFDTNSGPIAAGEALLQVILVPLALSIGGVAIGLIIRSARAAY